VLSPTGKYYESAIISAPNEISRWRDEGDNLILKLFFSGDFKKRVGYFTRIINKEKYHK